MKSLFSEAPVDEIKERGKLLAKCIRERGILLFGAGNTGRTVARAASGNDSLSVLGFIDDTPGYDGRLIEGLPIYSRESAIRQYGEDVPVAVCVWKVGCFYPKLHHTLLSSGFRNVSSLPDFARAFPESLLPAFYFSDVDVIISAQDQLIDLEKASRRRNLAKNSSSLLWFRITHDYAGMNIFDDQLYFPNFIEHAGRKDYVFVDCGAFDGDTILDLAKWRGTMPTRVLAFEPDKTSFIRMQDRVQPLVDCGMLEANLRNSGVGSSPGEIGFASMQDESSRVDVTSACRIPLETIDEVLNSSGWQANYIKYDIEGFERQGIEGARKTIEENMPTLAVSVYHRPEDLWSLPKILSDWQPKYKFYLRHHAEEGIDTVLYAVPG